MFISTKINKFKKKKPVNKTKKTKLESIKNFKSSSKNNLKKEIHM